MKMLVRQVNQKMMLFAPKTNSQERKKGKAILKRVLDAVFDKMKQTADADYEW